MSNDKLVKRGELILIPDQEEEPEEELKRMNKGKAGRPFTYIDSLIRTLAVLRVSLKLPHRQLAGFTRRFSRLPRRQDQHRPLNSLQKNKEARRGKKGSSPTYG